jgi:LemA protein
MSTAMIIGLSVVLIIIFFTIGVYNSLVRKKNEIDNAFAGIDVQLKKRYDLIPNIVNTVKEYAKHEKETLTKLTELRARALNNDVSMNEKIDIDNQISGALKSINIAVENYPDLKANENFINLQKTLNEVESQISAARRAFNAAVTDYNNSIMVFPNNLIASSMNFTSKKVFEISSIERENIEVGKLF